LDEPRQYGNSDLAEDEIDLLELASLLLRNKWVIFRWAVVAAVLTAVIVLLMRPTYTAEATFLPPGSLNTGSAALTNPMGALSLFGGLKTSGQIYVGILGSRTISNDIIHQFDLQKVYKEKRLSDTEKALKANSKFEVGKDSLITISVTDHDPQRAADIANAYLAELHKQNDRLALTEAAQRRVFFQQQLEQEKNALGDAEVDLAKTEEKTGLIQPRGQAELQIATIAQAQAEIASREVQLAALQQAATDQNPDVIRIRSEITGLQAQLKKLQDKSGSPGPGQIQVPTAKVPALTLEYVRKEREVKYHEALFALLARQYEAARLDESRSAPLMQVVDSATKPDKKSGPLRTVLTLAAFFLGGIFGIVWVIVRDRVHVLSNDPVHAEKLKALREAARLRSSADLQK